MKLHEVINDTKAKSWCGPSVVCSITGRKMSEVRKVFHALTYHNTKVMGTSKTQIYDVLDYFGYQMTTILDTNYRGTKTMARWLRDRSRAGYDRNKTYVLIVKYTPGHWVVVKGNKFCDSFTRKPVFISKAPHRRARVHAVYEISEPELVEYKKRRRSRRIDAS
jgi:hypothetical protein